MDEKHARSQRERDRKHCLIGLKGTKETIDCEREKVKSKQK